MSIAALILWAVTAGAGFRLLVNRASAEPNHPDHPNPPAPQAAQVLEAAQVSRPRTVLGTPLAPQERTAPRAAVPPGRHPLLEFLHPALGISGLACWFMFVLTHYHTFAWVALGVIAVTVVAGLSWLVSNTRAAKRQPDSGTAGPGFPARLVMFHGLAAATTVLVAVITALVASRT